MLSTVIDRELALDKSRDSSGLRIRCPLCGWSRRKEDTGSAPAAINGTRSTREACAPPASTSGLKYGASRAADGRRILSGMRSDPAKQSV